MKLHEIKPLYERLASYVHVNSDKTLSVIANLVQEKFGVPFSPKGFGLCLFSQFVYTLSSQTNIPIDVICEHYDFQKQEHDGHSPKELIDWIENTEIVYKKNLYKLKIGIEEFKNVSSVISSVESGQSVCMIMGSGNDYFRNSSGLWPGDAGSYDGSREAGEVRFGKKHRSGGKLENPKNHPRGYHAVLVIGYDSANDFLIIRDARDSYGFKGYLKTKSHEIQQHFKEFKFIAFYVDEMSKTSIK